MEDSNSYHNTNFDTMDENMDDSTEMDKIQFGRVLVDN